MSQIGEWVQEDVRQVRVASKSDVVVVVGGGPAGLSAAFGAARNGARVTLLERYNHLGGLASGGMVLVLDDMWDSHLQEISVRGNALEMIERMSALGLAQFRRQDEWGRDPAALQDQARARRQLGLLVAEDPAARRGVVQLPAHHRPGRHQGRGPDARRGRGPQGDPPHRGLHPHPTARLLEVLRDRLLAPAGLLALHHQQFRERFAGNTREHWLERLEAQDLLCAPVRDMREVLVDPQTLHNRMILEGQSSSGRPLRFISSPIEMSEAGVALRREPPQLGQHTDEVLGEMRRTALGEAA